MKFTTALVSVALAAAKVDALDYYVFSNTIDCQGANYKFSDGGAACHSGYPAAWGYSVQYLGLPQGTQGQGYTDTNCKSFRFSVYGPGTQCWKSGGGARAASVNWFHSPTGRREVAGANANATACAPPTAFNYQAGGEDRSIALASTEDAHRVGELYAAGDFAELEKYPKYVADSEA